MARRLKVELGEGKKRVYPQAVVTGQPPSVPSWDSTLFQSSGLRAGAPVLISRVQGQSEFQDSEGYRKKLLS